MEIDHYYEFRSASRINSLVTYRLVLASEKGYQNVHPKQVDLLLDRVQEDNRSCCRIQFANNSTIDVPLISNYGIAHITGNEDLILVRSLLKDKKMRVLIFKNARQYLPILS